MIVLARHTGRSWLAMWLHAGSHPIYEARPDDWEVDE